MNVSQVNEVEIANRLRLALLRLSRELRREIHSIGVTGGQVALLIAIKYAPGIGVRELATQERMSPAAISKAVTKLEQQGSSSAALEETGAASAVSEKGHRASLRALAPDDLARRATRWPLPGGAPEGRGCDRAAGAAPAVTARIFKSLRKHRNYRLFFTGQVVSLAGTWMQNIALAWFVIELTDSPLAVGGLAFCRFLPFMPSGQYAASSRTASTTASRTSTQAAQMLVSVSQSRWRSQAGRTCRPSTCSRSSAEARSSSTPRADSR